MTLLGIVFRQKNVIIGAKKSSKGLLGGIADEFKDSLVNTWSAVTSKGIVVDATVNEEHVTTCEVTENPVEDGATVTDHVQLNTAQLTIEGVITDSPLGYAVIGNIQNVVKTVQNVFGGTVRSIDAYNELVKLQKSRQPFDVITGLKKYSNMIMTELSVPRTSATGASIHFRAVMKEIRIVKSETTDDITSNSVGNLTTKTKDYGQKVTDPVPLKSPNSGVGSTSLSRQSLNPSKLQSWFGGNN